MIGIVICPMEVGNSSKVFGKYGFNFKDWKFIVLLRKFPTDIMLDAISMQLIQYVIFNNVKYFYIFRCNCK